MKKIRLVFIPVKKRQIKTQERVDSAFRILFEEMERVSGMKLNDQITLLNSRMKSGEEVINHGQAITS